MLLSATIQLIAVVALTGAAMFTDIRWRRIPNWLTVSGFAIAILFHVVTNGWQGLQFCLGGFAIGFGFLFVLWLIGGGGGGDVKLMGAVGAWLGAKPTLIVFVLSAFVGFLCLIAVMIWNAAGMKPLTASAGDPSGNYGTTVAGGHGSVLRRTIPYAIPAGLSAWILLICQMIFDVPWR